MKIVQYASVVFALALLVVWSSHGRHVATLEQELVTMEQRDDFGDVVTVTKWIPTLKIGLLDVVLPGLFGFAVIFAGSAVWQRRTSHERRRASWLSSREGADGAKI